MNVSADLHTTLHSFLSSISGSVEAHLIVATILSGCLIALTFFIRDPRIRRAASLAALIIFLIPIPDLLPDRSLQSFQFLLFDVSEGTTGAPPVSDTERRALDAICIALAAWLVVSALLLGRTLRDVLFSPRQGDPLPDRERKRLGLPDGVGFRLGRNGEGPYVAGLLRPVIVIPESLLESSDEQELRAVILHELTHVRQKDNLWGTLSALITSLFWVHPFTWLAALRFRASSEIACDAAVLEAGIPLHTYLESLRKLIATAPSERVAQMALGGGSLRERIRIMKSSPGTISGLAARLAVVTIAVVTLGAGLSLRAMVGGESPMSSALSAGDSVTAYRIAHQVVPLPDGILQADFAIIDIAAGQVLGLSTVRFLPGQPATMSTGHQDPATGEDIDVLIELDAIDQNTYSATTEIRRAGELVEKKLDVTVARAPEPARPLDLQLTEAKLQDVLDLFAKLLQSELVVAADISSERVTVALDDVPWDAALDDILLGRDLKWRKIGDLLIVAGSGNGAITKRQQPPVGGLVPRTETAVTDQNIQRPQVLERINPRYTPEAQEARVQGLVVVEVSVDENGIPQDVRVIKPLPMGLAEAAAEAVRQWKFSPATIDGKPVPFIFNVTINFTLPNETEA